MERQGLLGSYVAGAAGGGGEGERCSICLEPISGEGFLDQCFHKFCYHCILQWSEMVLFRSSDALNRPQYLECPLCKTLYTSIIHDVSDEKFQRHYILTTRVPGLLKSETHSRRLSVYSTFSGTTVLPSSSSTGIPKPNRWISCWVQRELQALMQEEDVDTVMHHVVGTVESLCKKSPKKVESSRQLGTDGETNWQDTVAAAVRPFIFEHAERFAVELGLFLVSGLDIAAYDQKFRVDARASDRRADFDVDVSVPSVRKISRGVVELYDEDVEEGAQLIVEKPSSEEVDMSSSDEKSKKDRHREELATTGTGPSSPKEESGRGAKSKRSGRDSESAASKHWRSSHKRKSRSSSRSRSPHRHKRRRRSKDAKSSYHKKYEREKRKRKVEDDRHRRNRRRSHSWKIHRTSYENSSDSETLGESRRSHEIDRKRKAAERSSTRRSKAKGEDNGIADKTIQVQSKRARCANERNVSAGCQPQALVVSDISSKEELKVTTVQRESSPADRRADKLDGVNENCEEMSGKPEKYFKLARRQDGQSSSKTQTAKIGGTADTNVSNQSEYIIEKIRPVPASVMLEWERTIMPKSATEPELRLREQAMSDYMKQQRPIRGANALAPLRSEAVVVANQTCPNSDVSCPYQETEVRDLHARSLDKLRKGSKVDSLRQGQIENAQAVNEAGSSKGFLTSRQGTRVSSPTEKMRCCGEVGESAECEGIFVDNKTVVQEQNVTEGSVNCTVHYENRSGLRALGKRYKREYADKAGEKVAVRDGCKSPAMVPLSNHVRDKAVSKDKLEDDNGKLSAHQFEATVAVVEHAETPLGLCTTTTKSCGNVCEGNASASETVPKEECQTADTKKFQRKSMSISRGGESVKVNYTVYIPERPRGLRRKLQR